MRGAWVSVLRWLGGAAAAALVVEALLSPFVTPFGKSIIAAVLLVSAWRPAEGLLLVAGLAPLGALLAAAFDFDPFRLGEAIVLAFLAAWLLRPAPAEHRGPRFTPLAATSGWLFGALVVASVAGMTWHVARTPGALSPTVSALLHEYFVFTDRLGVVQGALILEGLALAAATVELFRRRPALATELPAALAAGGAAAGLASVLLWRGLGPAALIAQQDGPGAYRVAAHVADVNAAGSYFVMLFALTLGMAGRERSARRLPWVLAAVMCGVGLWLTRSRTALAAAALVIPAAIVWAATVRARTRWRIAAFALLVLALAIGVVVRSQFGRVSTFGLAYRTEFTSTSLRMIATRPLFGVGIGQYYRDSTLFLTPELAWIYGAENAHDYFLQMAAEGGVVGVVLFLAFLGAMVAPAARALMRRRDWRLLGATGGLLAFLATSVAGHPLLVAEVAFAFWIVIGLTAGLGSDAVEPLGQAATIRRVPALRFVTMAAAAAIAVSVPVRGLRAPLTPPDTRAVDGFFDWERGRDGVTFRWTGRYASVFVPAGVREVLLPVRAVREGQSPYPLGVEPSVFGVGVGRAIAGDAWTTIRIPLEPPFTAIGYNRINLRVDRTWRPALFVPGSADLREVGVQVGEWRAVEPDD
jgi:O-antigen ligase